jgi:tetratricopeptide (TPR) repeat protein
MCFRFKRVSRLSIAAAALVLLMPLASRAQDVKQTATETPNWKDRQEYDLFLKMSQTADPKGRLELLNSWQDKYPQTDVAALRLKYYVATLAILAQTATTEREKLLDKCRDLLKLEPKDINALYQVSLWGPLTGGGSPSSAQLSEVQSAARGFIEGADAAFAPANKPTGISDADFDKAKSFRLGVAHNALAWVAIVQKDLTAAETEYKASLSANPEQAATTAQYAKFLYDQKRYPEALFHYARAAQYTGPGPSLTERYKEFHGGPDGVEQVLAQAKTSAFPPANFSIGSAADAAAREAEALNTRIASDPGFALWYTIRQNLTGEQGAAFFEKTVKDTMIPGGAQGVRNFSGTVISIDSPDKAVKISIGIDDPTKPDAVLEFSKPLPLDKIKAGQKIEFSGVVSQYVKDPYLLTFKDPSIAGVPTNVSDKKPAHKQN